MKITATNNILFNIRKTIAPERIRAGANLSFGAIRNDTYEKTYYFCPDYNGTKPDSKILNTLQNLPKGSDVADIGAGDGRNTLTLAQRGFNVSAFEICQAGCKLISGRSKARELSNVTVSQDDILKNPFSKKFDAAIMVHVSQHFTDEDLDMAFKNISESLKSGGTLIFDALIEKDDSIKPNTTGDVTSGYCHFPITTIEKLAKKYGFSTKEVSAFNEGLSSRGDYYGMEWGYGCSEQAPEHLEEVYAHFLTPEEQQCIRSIRDSKIARTDVAAKRPVELKWIVLEKN